MCSYKKYSHVSLHERDELLLYIEPCAIKVTFVVCFKMKICVIVVYSNYTRSSAANTINNSVRDITFNFSCHYQLRFNTAAAAASTNALKAPSKPHVDNCQ